MKYISNLTYKDFNYYIEVTDDITGDVNKYTETDFVKLPDINEIVGVKIDIKGYYVYVISKNAKDIKFSFMNPDVFIKTDGDYLLSLSVPTNKKKVLVLSDFCKVLTKDCFNFYDDNVGNLTLVFDDNLEIDTVTDYVEFNKDCVKFSYKLYLSISDVIMPVLDVTRCNDDKALTFLKCTAPHILSSDNLRRYIVANERVHSLFAIFSTAMGYTQDDFQTWVDDKYILEAFLENRDNILKVLNRRDLSKDEIDDICTKSFFTNEVYSNVAPNYIEASVLSSVFPLNVNHFVTFNDNYYLNLACMAVSRRLFLPEFDDFKNYCINNYKHPILSQSTTINFLQEILKKVLTFFSV